MKKLVLYVLGLLMVLIPFSAKATTVSLSVDCKQVTVGQTSSCSVYVTPSSGGGVLTAKGDITISGSAANVTGVSKGSLSNGDLSQTGFALYTDEAITTKFKLFTVNFSTVAVGSNTVKVNLTFFTDEEYGDNDVSKSASGTLTVNPKPTAATTASTTRNTVRVTQTATLATTQITVPTTQGNTLKLTSLKVGDFPVEEKDGVYYVTTNPDTEEVEIFATVPDGVQVTGLGNRKLGVGTNSVNLTLMNGSGGTAIISILITRPERSNDNTLLKELDVIDADLKFDPNTKEYTVTVPHTTKEVYIHAVAENPDAAIKGNGKYVLSEKENNVYVTVSFEDKSSTTYTIHIVKEYKGLIPIISLGIALLIAIIVAIYFFSKYNNTKKELKDKATATKANKERAIEEQGPQLNINGSSVTGIGARIVKPQSVEANIEADAEKKEDIVNPIKHEEPTRIMESHPTSVAGMVPPKEEAENTIKSASPQVKVVKRVVNPTTGEVRFITVTQNADE